MDGEHHICRNVACVEQGSRYHLMLQHKEQCGNADLGSVSAVSSEAIGQTGKGSDVPWEHALRIICTFGEGATWNI